MTGEAGMHIKSIFEACGGDVQSVEVRPSYARNEREAHVQLATQQQAERIRERLSGAGRKVIPVYNARPYDNEQGGKAAAPGKPPQRPRRNVPNHSVERPPRRANDRSCPRDLETDMRAGPWPVGRGAPTRVLNISETA